MNPMSVNELEAIMAEGCSVLGCKHESHDKLFLTQRCHPWKGVEIYCVNSVLSIRCYKCGLPVAKIALASTAVPPPLPQNCHPRSALDASYARGSGNVVIQCRECHEQIAQLEVALVIP